MSSFSMSARVREEILERPEVLNQSRRRLRPHTLDARNVVGRVPHQTLNVSDRARWNTEFLDDLRDPDAEIADGIVEGHLLGDALHEILVAGDEHDRVARSPPGAWPAWPGCRRPRSACRAKQRIAIASTRRRTYGNWTRELLVRSFSIRFVFGVDFATERRPRQVERRSGILRLLGAKETLEHRGDAVDGVRRQPRVRVERRQRVVGTEREEAHVESVELSGAPSFREALSGPGQKQGSRTSDVASSAWPHLHSATESGALTANVTRGYKNSHAIVAHSTLVSIQHD